MEFEDSVSAPGRVNLIGEHIDYHGLPVLPMAIGRRIRIAFRARGDRRIRASSAGYGKREFEWTARLECGPAGDWANYLKAAAQAAGERWMPARGIDARIESDLPPAAGLSSSSALLTGFTLALLRANGIRPTFEELMQVLPEAEHFVGTRGGGMDHAVVLAAKRGCALLVRFAPLSACPVPVPRDWAFLVAHSLETAEKSGVLRAEYNARRSAGTRALELAARGAPLEGDERRAFEHITGEAKRVEDAVAALRGGDAEAFGRLLDESHASLRDNLRVSTPALDALVETAHASGALGARLTGAGFGGCAVLLCRAAERDRIRAGLVEKFYSRRSGFVPALHLIDAEPSAGALGD
jgi:galactokinase